MLPKISPSWLKWFKRYARWYVSRHFHAVRISRAGGVPVLRAGQPVVFVANHPSWWDPLVLMLITDLFPDRQHFAPMDAAALEKYRFFAKLGMFGIKPGNGLRFVRTGRAVLAQPGNALWVTAQGRFADVRDRSVPVLAGVAALGCDNVIPVAIEYTFWHERFPEILIRFGKPGETLEATQEALAAEAMQQRAVLFDTLLPGRVGIGGVYDMWRRWRHTDFTPEHGALVRS
jgi:1-acyl-sn-glycerol-3-phosphate acyltransferase